MRFPLKLVCPSLGALTVKIGFQNVFCVTQCDTQEQHQIIPVRGSLSKSSVLGSYHSESKKATGKMEL